MDGQGLKPGYDSHISPKGNFIHSFTHVLLNFSMPISLTFVFVLYKYNNIGNEVVLFEPDQILPRYIVTFVEKEAEEREQES